LCGGAGLMGATIVLGGGAWVRNFFGALLSPPPRQ
jgi:hypothetical protein